MITDEYPRHVVPPIVYPGAHGWLQVGENRYTANAGAELGEETLLLVLLNPESKGYVCLPVSKAYLEEDPGFAEHSWRQMEAKMAREMLPPCVVPDCAEKGGIQFKAAEKGRLGGRDWTPGDQIDLCPTHAHDVYKAQFASRSELADWIKPDAILDPLDQHDADTDWMYSAQIAERQARMLRLEGDRP